MEDTPNSVGLTPRHIRTLRDTWAVLGVKEQRTENGLAFFEKFFELYPEVQDKFPYIKNMSVKEFRNSPEFQFQCRQVMGGIDRLVKVVDNPTVLVERAKPLVERHHKVHDVKLPEFEKIQIALPLFIKAVMGDAFTELINESWTRLLSAMTGLSQAQTVVDAKEAQSS